MSKLTTRVLLMAIVLGAGGGAGCADKARKQSIVESNLGMKAKSDDEKLAHLDRATSAWPGNNAAWYNKGVAYKDKQRWKDAAEAFEKAAQLVPKDPMYQMWLGISEYMRGIDDATKALAAKEGKKPEEVTPDLSAINFESAKQHLEQAVKLNKNMWRAHYYLGKINASQDKAFDAAQAFSSAIATNPREHGAYVALTELYRKWDQPEAAAKVATAATSVIIDRALRGDIWYALGMTHIDRLGVSDGESTKTTAKAAVEAFSKAIEDNPSNHGAMLQRGYAYFRAGEYKKAKEDLTAYQASKSNADKGLASKLINEITFKLN